MTNTTGVEEIVKEFKKRVVGEAADGSYIYHLMRDKQAFSIGTMELNDFVEIGDDDEWLNENADWLRVILEAKDKECEERVREERERVLLLATKIITNPVEFMQLTVESTPTKTDKQTEV